jgi:hypothetical protein
MIFNRFFFLVCFFPLAAFSANQPCGLNDFEQTGKGWLSAKTPGILRYVVARKQFESTYLPKSWTVSLQAREAALKAFSDFFRKASPPSADKNLLSVKGMQAKEMQCAEGLFIFYDVNLANLAWEAPVTAASQPKEDIGMTTANPMPTEPQVGMSSPKQPLVTPLVVPKVLIED